MSLPRIKTMDELAQLIDEVGLLPLFSCGIPGFSVMDVTDAALWWTDDPQTDPWQWRTLLAGSARVAYGKIFSGKAGFVSLPCYADFANFRRDGYDFDALYDDGKAAHASNRVMSLFDRENALPTYAIKQRSGIEKGFQGVLTRLQMQTYLTVSGFSRRLNKRGEAYGWPVAEYAPPERIFAEDVVRGAYCRDPADSLGRLERRLIPCAGTDVSQLLRA